MTRIEKLIKRERLEIIEDDIDFDYEQFVNQEFEKTLKGDKKITCSK